MSELSIGLSIGLIGLSVMLFAVMFGIFYLLRTNSVSCKNCRHEDFCFGPAGVGRDCIGFQAKR
jgi:hypothetical protein